MSTKYTRDYFIRKFEAIPDELWATDSFVNDKGQCCAFGHCGSREDGISEHSTDEADALGRLFGKGGGYRVSDINDGNSTRYQQPTPKARILAALRDLPTAKS